MSDIPDEMGTGSVEMKGESSELLYTWSDHKTFEKNDVGNILFVKYNTESRVYRTYMS